MSGRGVPPGPSAWRAVRSLAGGDFAATLRFVTAMSAEFGPISSFRVGARRIVLVDEPDLIRDVLVTHQHAFGRTAAMDLVRAFLGSSIVTSDEPVHRERRRTVQPAFNRNHVGSYGAIMSDELARLCAEWRTPCEIDIVRAMLRYTIGVTGRAIFGADVGDRAASIDAALHDAMATIAGLAPIAEMLPAPLAAAMRYVPPASRRFGRARRALIAATAPAVAERARTRTSTGDDVLALLLRANDRLDDSAIADELVTLLFAGHETTAMSLAWMWLALAEQPTVVDRLRAELELFVGDRVPTADDLDALPYVRAVFLETLRLYPPAAVYARRVVRPVAIGGYDLAVGTTILLSPYVTQRNGRYHDEPLRFRPERWLEADAEARAFFPFGAGARACIGERFAMLEGMLALATIAAAYDLRRVDTAPIKIASHATLRPAGRVAMRVTPRR
jgi:cytochrome P450